ncbi:MAG: CvpA family protein [Acidobacteriaceae bacterium]
MTIFDWVILAIIVLSAIVAASQGFLLEIFSLAGLVFGLWLALWNYRVLAVPFAHVIPSERIADALAFLLISFGVMLILGLIGRLFSKLAHTAGLGALDGLLGAIFGVIRGCALVVVAIIAIAAFFPQKTWMRGSKLAPSFLSAANEVSAGAPAELRRKIQEGVIALEHVRPLRLQLDLHPDPATR